MATSLNVRVIFEGLVAIVPDKTLNFMTPVAVTSVDVFFLDVRYPRDSSTDIKDGAIRHPHVLWIELDEDGYDAASTRKPLMTITPTGGSPRHLFPLIKPQKISYVLQGAHPLEISQSKPANPDDPSNCLPEHQKSLWWVPRPGERTGNAYHGIFLERLSMCSHVSISHGYLFTAGFSNSGSLWNFYESYPWSSKLVTNPKPRALANRVGLDLNVDAYSLHFESGDSIILKKRADGRPTELHFRNIEGEALLGAEIVSKTGPDPDFTEYYRSSVGAAIFKWILPKVDGTTGSVRKPCAPALYDRKI